MTSLPDGQMQALLRQARSYSTDAQRAKHRRDSEQLIRRAVSPMLTSTRRDSDSGVGVRRQSAHASDLFSESAARRLSEAGVNRRPSAAQILTEDTDSFIVGQRVYVDGVKPGRIQFIGETKFGPGDWAGVVLDDSLGKNDGSVGKTRYFQCEPYHGVFSRLFRLTAEPIEGAGEVLAQMRRYGYEIVDAPIGRRGSVGSGGGSRRGSTSIDERRGSMDRGSVSPRASTPEMRRSSIARHSPEPRRVSLTVPERSGNIGRRVTPGKSPLASPSPSRSVITGGDVRIEKDPDMTKLAQEARRLSMGAANNSVRRTSEDTRRSSPMNRRPSEGFPRSPRINDRRQSDLQNGSPRRPSDLFNRRPSGVTNRRGSEALTTERRDSSGSFDEDHDRRRLSEAGMRRQSVAGANSDAVLTEDTSSLMVGQHVYVDGDKPGRIAYIGGVRFAKGEVAGVHLERPEGKNNGTIGGVMYFQCEPKHGIFARLHRLTREPIISEEDEY